MQYRMAGFRVIISLEKIYWRRCRFLERPVVTDTNYTDYQVRNTDPQEDCQIKYLNLLVFSTHFSNQQVVYWNIFLILLIPVRKRRQLEGHVGQYINLKLLSSAFNNIWSKSLLISDLSEILNPKSYPSVLAIVNTPPEIFSPDLVCTFLFCIILAKYS